ncbi:MAG: phage major capsid protein [Clostridia bacterium]|nr:phage major capsid protein [Clostridia bacterium]
MVTLQTAEDALKSVYLGVVSDQLNINANPLLNKIKQSTSDVWGKEIIKLAPFGINGGIGAGSETDSLPQAQENKYVKFITTLKNLYGTIEISDKAMRASANNSGAFVNLLNAEMEGLVKASTFNFGRMLYGDGSGVLATIASHTAGSNVAKLDSVKNVIEGMFVDFINTTTGEKLANSARRIAYVDRANKTVTFEGAVADTLTSDYVLVVQGSYNNEITGLGKIFDANATTLYGLTKANYPWLQPYTKEGVGEISDAVIQTAIDEMEEYAGSTVDFITCSSAVKRAYQTYLTTYRRNIDVMDLAGGYKAISYAGIPVVSDRFIKDDEMYLLNTKEFTLHQLCDWQWLEGEDGRIIKQKQGFPVYTATLVKYADLICDKPNGQAKLSGIAI